MNILALETSSALVGCAISIDGELAYERVVCDPARRSEALLEDVGAILASCRLSMDSIDLMALGAGPGSYTGLRVGAAAVKGLAFGLDVKVALFSSLYAAALGLSARVGRIRVVADAQKESVYTAAFFSSGFALDRLEEDSMADLDSVLARESKGDMETIFTGDATLRHGERIRAAGFLVAPPPHCYPSAGLLATAAFRSGKPGDGSKVVDPNEFLPNYLREFEIRVK